MRAIAPFFKTIGKLTNKLILSAKFTGSYKNKRVCIQPSGKIDQPGGKSTIALER